MIKQHRSISLRSAVRSQRQGGAALVVGLILLLVLTLLAISGMNTATLELQMAGNAQFSENAFQAAETGIEAAMQAVTFDTAAAPTIEATLPSSADTYETITRFNQQNGETNVPAGGFSMGVGSGFSAYHFDVTSTGASSRSATSTHVQGFYVIGQSSH